MDTSRDQLERLFKAAGGAGPFQFEEQQREPQPGDYIVSDSGPLGSYYTVSTVDTGEECKEYREEGLAEIADYIQEAMDSQCYWSNVWILDDHGGLRLTTLNEMRA